MVFFTCSHCGESVKKPAVAKHYQTKCRKNEPFLTCVDCLKDFKGNEYEAHTKCLTEDERYSAKGYVPKPSQNKGERKQQAWQECIQTVLKRPTLRPDERDLISAISKYENVPRKKSKFINFLSNAFRQYANRKDLIDRVWTEMESVFKETASTNGEQTQQEEKPQKEEPENVPENPAPKTDENGVKKEKKRKRPAEAPAESSEPAKTEEKVKKKKHKSNDEIPAEVNGNGITEETEVKQEKKNKKRKKAEEENGLPPAEQNDSVPEETEPSKKKKKKKHEKPAETEVSEPAAESVETESKNKKKNKKSRNENVESNSGAPGEEEAERGAGKKEKKGKKSEDKENCSAAVGEEDGEKEGKAKEKKKNGNAEGQEDGGKQETFDWKATILNVLNQDGKNNKIQLQKLQKKVLKRHCQVFNCETSQKKEKKFMKKLKEMPQIEIDNDFVVLKS